MKQCTRCLEYKPLGLFGSREKGKKRSHCRNCVNKSNLDRYHRNHKTRDAHRRASYKYQMKSYGLTPEPYQKLYDRQDGCCAICKVKPDERLNIDHDHVTGQVRALLCRNCNTALGHAKENIERLKAMIEYLEIHE